MNNFNLCDAFFSGYYFFREEFASCALGYALSPFSSGGTRPLEYMVEQLLKITRSGQQRKLLEELQQKLQTMFP